MVENLIAMEMSGFLGCLVQIWLLWRWLSVRWEVAGAKLNFSYGKATPLTVN